MYKNTGFTLIELLVVVLIIGILASVALPQYRVAVAKSRLSALIPNVRALKDGLEMYYLANGAYPPDSTEDFGFDISVPPGCTQAGTTQANHCPDGTVYDLLDYGTPTVLGGNKNAKIGYVIWLDHSAHPGVRQCVAATSNATANKVCKSMGGTVSSGAVTRYFASTLGEATTSYDLP